MSSSYLTQRAQSWQRAQRKTTAEKSQLRGWLVALLAFALATVPGVARAQEATVPTASIVVDGTPVTVGDVIPLALEVHHPSGTVAILPTLEQGWGDFEVRSQGPVEVDETADGLVTRQIIEATLFAPGDFSTPELAVALTDGGGNTIEVVALPISVTVQSVLTADETEPRDIKGQAEIGAAFPTTAAVAIGGALALVALGGWWLWRRKGVGGFLVRTPLQRVLDELDAIEKQGYPAREEYKQHYLAVSNVVRAFAQRQLGLPLQERTTTEMRQLMRHARVPQETIKQMLALFNECDLVKFSQVTPTEESAAALLTEARSLVTLLARGEAPEPINAIPIAEPQVHG